MQKIANIEDLKKLQITYPLEEKLTISNFVIYDPKQDIEYLIPIEDVCFNDSLPATLYLYDFAYKEIDNFFVHHQYLKTFQEYLKTSKE